MSEKTLEGKLDLGVAELRWRVFPPNYNAAMVEVVLLGVIVETFTFSNQVIMHRCDRQVGESNVIAKVTFEPAAGPNIGKLVAEEFTCKHSGRPQQMTAYTMITWDSKGNEQ